MPLLTCPQCKYSTKSKSSMADHVRVHTGDRPFCCSDCGKSFTQKSNLRQHMKVHGGGYKEIFKCDKCEFTTKWKTSLNIHLRWHNGEKPYACKLCGKTFSQSTHRRTHMRESHADIRKFQCEICSKCFKRRDHLDRHQEFHLDEKNHACQVCGKRFSSFSSLRYHRLLHMGEESKKYMCDKCPYKSRYNQGLKVHYRIHTGEKPYTCDASNCGKKFTTSGALKLHRRMVHQGMAGKIFHCALCLFSTANKQSLHNHHKRIHLGWKERLNIRCRICTKVYQTRGAMWKHLREKHPEEMEDMRTSGANERESFRQYAEYDRGMVSGPQPLKPMKDTAMIAASIKKKYAKSGKSGLLLHPRAQLPFKKRQIYGESAGTKVHVHGKPIGTITVNASSVTSDKHRPKVSNLKNFHLKNLTIDVEDIGSKGKPKRAGPNTQSNGHKKSPTKKSGEKNIKAKQDTAFKTKKKKVPTATLR